MSESNHPGTTTVTAYTSTTTRSVTPPMTTTGHDSTSITDEITQSTSTSNPPDTTTKTTHESTVFPKTTSAVPRTTGEPLTFTMYETSSVTEPITNTGMAMQSTSMRSPPDKTRVKSTTIVMPATSDPTSEPLKPTTHETTGTPPQTATVTDPATTNGLSDTPVVMLPKTSVEQTTASHLITTTLAPLDLDPAMENEGFIYLHFRMTLDFIEDYYYKTTHEYKELERDVITEVMYICTLAHILYTQFGNETFRLEHPNVS